MSVTPLLLSSAFCLTFFAHIKGEDVFPIPGTKSPERVVENAGATFVSLTAEEVKEVEAAVPDVIGHRSPDMTSVFENRL